MRYVYAALLLHTSGQKIDEANLTNLLKATGGEVDSARIKALIASLSDVNIDEAIKMAPELAVAPAPITEPKPEQEVKKEEEEEETKEEEALAGLGALFG